MKKLGLLPRILIAIVLGIAIGYISPMWFARIMATFNTIFSQFLGFMIPMIIVGFVAPAIADIGGRAGKLLVVTAAIAYIATFFAGILSYLTGTLSFPSLIGGEQGMALLGDTSKVLPFFNIEMPPLMTVMTALVFAFMFGLGMAFVKGTALRKGFDELRDIVSKTIDTAILPLLPFYIFGIFLNMTLEGQGGMILKCFIKIIVIIFILHVFILILQYCIASLFARKTRFQCCGQCFRHTSQHSGHNRRLQQYR